MRWMPTSVLPNWTRPMFTSKPVFSYCAVDKTLGLDKRAHLFLKTFILRLIKLLELLVLQDHSGVILLLYLHPQDRRQARQLAGEEGDSLKSILHSSLLTHMIKGKLLEVALLVAPFLLFLMLPALDKSNKT